MSRAERLVGYTCDRAMCWSDWRWSLSARRAAVVLFPLSFIVIAGLVLFWGAVMVVGFPFALAADVWNQESK